jgi:hypothetical protein
MPEEDDPATTTTDDLYHCGCPRRVSQYFWISENSTRKGPGVLGSLVKLNIPNLRICVTSRPEIDIHDVLEPLASHHMSLHDEGGQQKDIVDYVRTTVLTDRKMRRWRPEDKQLVIDILSAKAGGM